MRTSLLPLAAWLCRRFGINNLCKPVYGGQGLILMFHRFTCEPEKRIDISGVVSSNFLEKLLSHIRTTGPEIIALRDVPQAIASRRPFVCLTIDDGYRDNAEVALPIFRRYEAPATIFVPSRVLDRSLDAWWLQIEEIAKNQTCPRKAYTKMVLAATKSTVALERMRDLFLVDQKDLNDRYFLNAEEVRTIANDPLIDIGGHTISHPRLKDLSDKEAFSEIIRNKQDLEKLTGKPVDCFAYPYGTVEACGIREFTYAEKAGYKIAVTTRDGNIHVDHLNFLTALPRYSVRGHLEHPLIYDMQSCGAYLALKTSFGPATAVI